ncbi:MAG: ATP-grasp domain-containing protein [Candidatus Thorarchaeota archaeon]
MKKNTIFIFEFVSGGGFNRYNIPTSLFCEGFGMLRSIVTDFKMLGFEIYTTLDDKIHFLSKYLKADVIRKVEKSDNYVKIFKNLVNICKYVFIIAPETSKILYNLTKIVKSSKKIVLSTNLNGIKYGALKIKTYKFFRDNKIPTPRTYKIPSKKNLLDQNYLIKRFRELNCPILIKPNDGVGAELIHYFNDESQILNYFTNYETILGKNRRYILQEFIEGRDLSISLIGNYNSSIDPLILSVNSQNVMIKNSDSEYLGGYTPLENHKEIIKDLSIIINRIKMIKIEGYFGIDFIRKSNHLLYFIEINPRLTTSYIGIRNVINFNCAELILNSKSNFLKNPEIKFQNYSYFTRIDFFYNKDENFKTLDSELIPKLTEIVPEFVTPPISLNLANFYSSFIATKTKDLISSKNRLREILSTLEKMNFNIIKPKQPKL